MSPARETNPRRKKSVDQKSKCLQSSDASHNGRSNELHAPSQMLAATGLSSPTPQAKEMAKEVLEFHGSLER
jgi:hypothetical protein